jgi:hypothetical protein
MVVDNKLLVEVGKLGFRGLMTGDDRSGLSARSLLPYPYNLHNMQGAAFGDLTSRYLGT